jgi:capsular exopolysaccharide synthesis family protein
MVVTSPGPKEGKTFVTSNLGIAMAEINKRVLVVEADLRRPTLHKVLGVESDSGLETILRESVPIAEYDLTKVIRPTGVPNLHILPRGQCGLEVWPMLCSSRMVALMERLRKEFDLVLIDTAPLLATPDARVIARLSDGVVLVVRSGVTGNDDAASAVQRFAEDDTPVLGTILNDWKPPRSSARYAGYYAYAATGSNK